MVFQKSVSRQGSLIVTASTFDFCFAASKHSQLNILPTSHAGLHVRVPTTSTTIRHLAYTAAGSTMLSDHFDVVARLCHSRERLGSEGRLRCPLIPEYMSQPEEWHNKSDEVSRKMSYFLLCLRNYEHVTNSRRCQINEVGLSFRKRKSAYLPNLVPQSRDMPTHHVYYPLTSTEDMLRQSFDIFIDLDGYTGILGVVTLLRIFEPRNTTPTTSLYLPPNSNMLKPGTNGRSRRQYI